MCRPCTASSRCREDGAAPTPAGPGHEAQSRGGWWGRLTTFRNAAHAPYSGEWKVRWALAYNVTNHNPKCLLSRGHTITIQSPTIVCGGGVSGCGGGVHGNRCRSPCCHRAVIVDDFFWGGTSLQPLDPLPPSPARMDRPRPPLAESLGGGGACPKSITPKKVFPPVTMPWSCSRKAWFGPSNSPPPKKGVSACPHPANGEGSCPPPGGPDMEQ